jgi:hypothetical protein
MWNLFIMEELHESFASVGVGQDNLDNIRAPL